MVAENAGERRVLSKVTTPLTLLSDRFFDHWNWLREQLEPLLAVPWIKSALLEPLERPVASLLHALLRETPGDRAVVGEASALSPLMADAPVVLPHVAISAHSLSPLPILLQDRLQVMALSVAASAPLFDAFAQLQESFGRHLHTPPIGCQHERKVFSLDPAIKRRVADSEEAGSSTPRDGFTELALEVRADGREIWITSPSLLEAS